MQAWWPLEAFPNFFMFLCRYCTRKIIIINKKNSKPISTTQALVIFLASWYHVKLNLLWASICVPIRCFILFKLDYIQVKILKSLTFFFSYRFISGISSVHVGGYNEICSSWRSHDETSIQNCHLTLTIWLCSFFPLDIFALVHKHCSMYFFSIWY